VEYGFDQGLARGRAEARADALVTILSARGIVPSAAQLDRVRSCGDVALLDRWIARAATASTADEVFVD
jgi:hypothetical protein